ncbi:transposase [Listeria booriae]|uniref:T7SS effector LXG polymorphic toxin n=1 Tax=Listeria booriae TaxID=1552123 RepID=UPI0016256936|nr:T7SS effector LXG polymorphic toxin [Listeria booriae]MBC1574665.1 transposase [Listeria booriae]
MTRIDIAEVTHFRSQLRATNQEITPRIEAVKQAVMNYLNDGSITGEAIQASKEYYAGAYVQLCGSIKQALKMSEDKLQQYIQDFHSQVDSSHNARLDADGIYDLNQKINGFENRMENLTAELSAINGTQKASELNYLATQIFEAHKKEQILAKYLDFERSHANFFNELGELAHYIKQALQDIQKNIRFDRVTGTYSMEKVNRTNFSELSRLYASQQAIDDKIKEIEDIGLTPVIPKGNSAGFILQDGQLNTTVTLGFVNEQMLYWENESTFRELFFVGSSYRVLYGIDAVTGQHVTDSRLAFDLLVLASSAFGVSSFATRFGAAKTASFDKNIVLKNIEASKAARASSNFNVYASKEKAVLRDVEGRIYGTEKASESKSIITSEMEEKILWGQRKNPNKNEIIGGHSSTINNSNPNYATETIKINSERTRDIKFTTQFPDGNLAKIKNSTVFPDGWSDTKILDSIKDIGNSSPISVRGRDGATFHRAIVDGVEIDVIKLGDNIISGYPTGKVNAPFPGGFTR